MLLQQQIECVDNIECDFVLMMCEMVIQFDQFVNFDLFFQLEGEDGCLVCIECLYEFVDDVEVFQVECYCVILNVYEIEVFYGCFVVVFEEMVFENGVLVIVDVLCIGCVVMICCVCDDQGFLIFYVGVLDW